MSETNETPEGICLEWVQDCHQDGEAVYECSDCGGLTCGECEFIPHGGPEIDYQIVRCGLCNKTNIGSEAWGKQQK